MTNFNVEIRERVNDSGWNITQDPIRATREATETIEFIKDLGSAGNWLFINVVDNLSGGT